MIMRNPLGGNLLIEALLDRLGSAQAQALLARLNESLCRNERDSYPGTIERRQERIGLCYLTESRTSQTSKETQP
jgi:hypothetical protein